MSDNVLSFGMMAPLVTPITDAIAKEAMRDILDDTPVQLNYEGTLLYSDHRERAAGDIAGIVFMAPDVITEFYAASQRLDLHVTHEAVVYSAAWYNGADSDMDELTLEQFLERTGQNHPEEPKEDAATS